MIIGIGSDLCDIRRIEESLEKFGEQFEKKCFTAAEIEKAHSRNNDGNNSVAATFAKRFAAKEACAKALGLGIGEAASWKDIEVTNAPNGRPSITLHGAACETLAQLTPEGKTAQIHLTLCDEYPYAQAFVVIEAV